MGQEARQKRTDEDNKIRQQDDKWFKENKDLSL